MPSARAIPVEQLDRKTGELIDTHESVYAAANAIGQPAAFGNINKAANGKLKSAYGFRWRYQVAETAHEDEEWKPYEDVEVSSYGRVRRTTASGQHVVSEPKPVVTINGKQWAVHRLIAHVFLGMPDDASITVKVNGAVPHVDTIRICQKTHGRDDRDANDNPKAPKRIQQWTHSGAIMLNEYNSISEAARAHGLSTSQICKSATGKEKTAGGFTWKYASA